MIRIRDISLPAEHDANQLLFEAAKLLKIIGDFERISDHAVNIAESADWAFVVNKVNRDAIVQGLQDREFAAERIVVADSFAEASAKLAQMMQAGDIVLYENDLPDSFK